MLPYVAFYTVTTGMFLHKLYAAYLRKAPVIESDILITQYTTLEREKAKKAL